MTHIKNRCLFIFFVFFLFVGVLTQAVSFVSDTQEIREGIVCQHQGIVHFKKNGKITATIQLSEPVIVAQAEQVEDWGYFQFPGVSVTDDGIIIVGWSMAGDSHIAYGMKSERQTGPMMSLDGGKTWQKRDKIYSAHSLGYSVELTNGDVIQSITPASKDITQYTNFPKSVARRNNYVFYPVSKLPEELQGVYLNYFNHQTNINEIIHAKLNDPNLLRYAIDGLMPIIWWGNIKELGDGSLVAGMYPAFYPDGKGGVLHGAIAFYRSIDKGHTWDLQGKIPFTNNGLTNYWPGFNEPAYEILEDGSFVCVMRTKGYTPMYISFSKNQGKTWEQPKPFTPNGAKPQLFLMNNGVLVLSSGRPGVQLRFSLDGSGREWTKPIDMMPFMKDNGEPDLYRTCGYTSIYPSGNDSFYLVYSDFHSKNDTGEDRKAIMFREVRVKKK